VTYFHLKRRWRYSTASSGGVQAGAWIVAAGREQRVHGDCSEETYSSTFLIDGMCNSAPRADGEEVKLNNPIKENAK